VKADECYARALFDRIERLRTELYRMADDDKDLIFTSEMQKKSQELDALVCRYIRRYCYSEDISCSG